MNAVQDTPHVCLVNIDIAQLYVQIEHDLVDR